MLEFVETLTLAPWEASERDWVRLHGLGMHELEIAQVVLGCAHFNYLNRMADGLGIPAEYGGNLETYEPGRGQERREEIAGQDSRAGRTNSAGEFSRLPVNEALVRELASLFSEAPRELVAALSFNADLARGVLAWRAFQLRGTPLLSARLRAKIEAFAAGVEFAEGAAKYASERAIAIGVDPAELAQLKELTDGEVPLSASDFERTVLEHVLRLLRSPASTKGEHIETLRGIGFDDREIVRLTMLVSYLSFEHRVRAGLLAS